MYRILIQELDKDGNGKTLHDGKVKNMMILAETEDDKQVMEAIVNTSIRDMAAMIGSSKKVYTAAKLAVFAQMAMGEDAGQTKGEVQ